MAGNDLLQGGLGNDSYVLYRGHGQDTIIENDSSVGNLDQLLLGNAVRADQVWLSQQGNDLLVSIIGTSDQMRIQDWYNGAANRVEQFVAQGKTLSDSKVQTLVDAMASLTPPAMGETRLSAEYQAQLGTVIAANWN